jgi:hypothetical protein
MMDPNVVAVVPDEAAVVAAAVAMEQEQAEQAVQQEQQQQQQIGHTNEGAAGVAVTADMPVQVHGQVEAEPGGTVDPDDPTTFLDQTGGDVVEEEEEVEHVDLALLRFETTQKKYYKHFLTNLGETLLPQSSSSVACSSFCDVRVYCSSGYVDVSGALLAAVSPVFRACGWLISLMEPGAAAIVLPDVNKEDLECFLK